MENNSLNVVAFEKSQHDAKSFDCGNEALNQFIRQYAVRQQKKHVGRTFVTLNQQQAVIGFYTLSTGSLRYEDAPITLRQGLPRYPIPTVVLGRLAVDKNHQGKGLGGRLLKDALLRVLKAAEHLGIVAITVNAKDYTAAEFYKQYGFISFQERDLILFIPLETVMTACNPKKNHRKFGVLKGKIKIAEDFDAPL